LGTTANERTGAITYADMPDLMKKSVFSAITIESDGEEFEIEMVKTIPAFFERLWKKCARFGTRQVVKNPDGVWHKQQ